MNPRMAHRIFIEEVLGGSLQSCIMDLKFYVTYDFGNHYDFLDGWLGRVYCTKTEARTS
jgi:hypothetical protein